MKMNATLTRWNQLTDGNLTMRAPLHTYEMRRMVDDLFRNSYTGVTSATYPFCDVVETGDSYIVSIEIPGLKLDDVQLRVQDNTLSLHFIKQSQKQNEGEENGRTYRYVGRFGGTFERHFPFAAPIDADQVKASYKDGVLEITLPKAEDSRTRNISIDISNT
jgi:HSP20 family protein